MSTGRVWRLTAYSDQVGFLVETTAGGVDENAPVRELRVQECCVQVPHRLNRNAMLLQDREPFLGGP